MLESYHDVDPMHGWTGRLDGDGDGTRDGPPCPDVARDIDVSPLLFFSKRGGGDDGDGGDGKLRDEEYPPSELTRGLISLRGGGERVGGEGRDGGMSPDDRTETTATRVNKNAFLHLLLRFVQGAADSLWRGAVLSLLVAGGLAPGDPGGGRAEYFRFAGYLEGMHGLGRILASMLYPDAALGASAEDVGLKGDVLKSQGRRRRQRDEINRTPPPGRRFRLTLRCAGLVRCATAAANIALLARLPNGEDIGLIYQLLMPIVLLYGYSSSVLLSSSASSALLRLSGSTPSDDEWGDEGIGGRLVLASNVVGPLISVLVFGIRGNAYTMQSLRICWYVGCALEILVGTLSLGFSERYCIPSEEVEEDPPTPIMSNSREERHRNGGANFDDEADGDEDGGVRGMRESQLRMDRALAEEEGGLRSQTEDASDTHQAATDGRLNAPEDVPAGGRGTPPPSMLPQILFALCALLFAGGGGLFHAYWPVFLKDVPQLAPMQLQSLYSSFPILTMLCEVALRKCFGREKIARRCGIGAALRSLGAASALLIGTGAVGSLGDGGAVLSVLFVARMAGAALASNLFEPGAFAKHLPSKDANAWNIGMKMAQMVAWSISAAVGGVLVESKHHSVSGNGGGGYGYVLCLTGILESIGVAMMILCLLWLCRIGRRVGSSDRSQ